MFVIESCQKIKYNALFMMIFIPVSNFGDQSLCTAIIVKMTWAQKQTTISLLCFNFVGFLENTCGNGTLEEFRSHPVTPVGILQKF